MRFVTLCFIGAGLVAAAAPARAQPDPAADPAQLDAHVAAAAAYYEVGNFEGALAEYRAAFAISPQPDFLFAMAMIEQQRGGCAEAIALADQFAATSPPAVDVEVLEEALGDCRTRQAEAAAALPVRETIVEVPAAPRRIRKPFYADALGDVLVGAGVVAGVAAGGLYVRARDQLTSAEEPGLDEPTYQDRWDTARRTRTYAAAAAGVGAALIVTGVVRWLSAEHWETVPVQLDGGATADGAQVSAAFRF